jgi:hypothetical protein
MTRYFGNYNKATFFRIYFSRYFYPFYKKATAYSVTPSSINLSKHGYFYSDSYYFSRNLSSEVFKMGINVTPYNKFLFQAFFTYFSTTDNKLTYDLYWSSYINRFDLFKNFIILFMRLKFQINFSFKFTKVFCVANSFRQIIKLYGYFFSNC